MSPAISTVILIAITITLSLAVGAWLRGISTEYMRIEVMSLDAAYATVNTTPDIDDTITASVRNSGKDSIHLDRAYVNGAPVPSSDFAVDLNPLLVDGVSTVIITLPLDSATTYEVKIVSTRGTQLEFSVRTP